MKDGCAPGVAISETLSRKIGRMTEASPAIPTAPLHYRALQSAKNEAFRYTLSYDSTVKLSIEIRSELQLWINELKGVERE